MDVFIVDNRKGMMTISSDIFVVASRKETATIWTDVFIVIPIGKKWWRYQRMSSLFQIANSCILDGAIIVWCFVQLANKKSGCCENIVIVHLLRILSGVELCDRNIYIWRRVDELTKGRANTDPDTAPSTEDFNTHYSRTNVDGQSVWATQQEATVTPNQTFITETRVFPMWPLSGKQPSSIQFLKLNIRWFQRSSVWSP